MRRVYVAVGAGGEAATWGVGDDPALARLDAVERVERTAEATGEDAWEPGEDPHAWAAAMAIVVIEGPAAAVATVLGDLLDD